MYKLNLFAGHCVYFDSDVDVRSCCNPVDEELPCGRYKHTSYRWEKRSAHYHHEYRVRRNLFYHVNFLSVIAYYYGDLYRMGEIKFTILKVLCYYNIIIGSLIIE